MFCAIIGVREGAGYFIRWDDSSLYHSIVNTGKWELETAAQIIVNAVERLPVK
jgi:cytidylate kinase